MKKTWQAFWRLGAGDQILVFEAAAMLLASRVGLRLFGFQRWKKFLSPSVPAVKNSLHSGMLAEKDEKIELSHKIARLEAAASRRLFVRVNCLEQSLTLWWLLRRRGIDAELRIGGRKENGRFEAHAWVEFDGVVLSEADNEHHDFVPFEDPASPVETPTH
jgi:hypothetical protein